MIRPRDGRLSRGEKILRYIGSILRLTLRRGGVVLRLNVRRGSRREGAYERIVSRSGGAGRLGLRVIQAINTAVSGVVKRTCGREVVRIAIAACLKLEAVVRHVDMMPTVLANVECFSADLCTQLHSYKRCLDDISTMKHPEMIYSLPNNGLQSLN